MKRSWNWIDAVLVAVGLIPGIVALLVYNRLPDPLATHFNLSGEANGYMPKLSGVLLLTLIGGATPILLKVFRKIDPKRENYDKFQRAFEAIRLVITLFLSTVLLLSILYNLGYQTMKSFVLFAGLGVLFIVMGNFMGQIQFNYTLGIKTPWTLASEEVWRKTHRLAGPLWVICGVLLVAASFFSGGWVQIIGLLSFGVAFVVPIVYSFTTYRKIKKT